MALKVLSARILSLGIPSIVIGPKNMARLARLLWSGLVKAARLLTRVIASFGPACYVTLSIAQWTLKLTSFEMRHGTIADSEDQQVINYP